MDSDTIPSTARCLSQGPDQIFLNNDFIHSSGLCTSPDSENRFHMLGKRGYSFRIGAIVEHIRKNDMVERGSKMQALELLQPVAEECLATTMAQLQDCVRAGTLSKEDTYFCHLRILCQVNHIVHIHKYHEASNDVLRSFRGFLRCDDKIPILRDPETLQMVASDGLKKGTWEIHLESEVSDALFWLLDMVVFRWALIAIATGSYKRESG